MMPFKPIDTHGSGPPAQYFEPDAATVEACAKVARECFDHPEAEADPEYIASAIRTLVSGEPQNSAGTFRGSHRGSPAGESDPAVTQDCAPAGTVSEADERKELELKHGLREEDLP